MMHTPAHKQTTSKDLTLGDYIQRKVATEPPNKTKQLIQEAIDLLESGRVSTAVALLKELV